MLQRNAPIAPPDHGVSRALPAAPAEGAPLARAAAGSAPLPALHVSRLPAPAPPPAEKRLRADSPSEPLPAPLARPPAGSPSDGCVAPPSPAASAPTPPPHPAAASLARYCAAEAACGTALASLSWGGPPSRAGAGPAAAAVLEALFGGHGGDGDDTGWVDGVISAAAGPILSAAKAPTFLAPGGGGGPEAGAVWASWRAWRGAGGGGGGGGDAAAGASACAGASAGAEEGGGSGGGAFSSPPAAARPAPLPSTPPPLPPALAAAARRRRSLALDFLVAAAAKGAHRGELKDRTFFMAVALLDRALAEEGVAAGAGGDGGVGGGGSSCGGTPGPVPPPSPITAALCSPHGALSLAAAALWACEKAEEVQGGHRSLDAVVLQLIPEAGYEWGFAPEGALPLAPRLAPAALGSGVGGVGVAGRAHARARLRDNVLQLELALLDAAGWRLFAPTPDAFLPVLLLREGGAPLLAAVARTLLFAGAHGAPAGTGARAEQQAAAAVAIAKWALRGGGAPQEGPRAAGGGGEAARDAGAWVLTGVRAVFGGGAGAARALAERVAGAQWRGELGVGGAGELFKAIGLALKVGE